MGTRYNGRKRRRRGKRLPAPVKGAKKSARQSAGSLWTHLGIAIAFWTVVSTIGYVLWTCRGAAIGI